jgi:hypothetical protein
MLGKEIYQHHKEQAFKANSYSYDFRNVFGKTPAVLKDFQHFYQAGCSNYLIEFGNSCHSNEL